jgi:pectate lyase
MTRSATLLLMLSAVALLSCQPAGYVRDAVAAAAGERMPAFAGAAGFGSNATGWRGGAVIKVTTLDDRGPGSLRACAEGSRARVCIFEVAGTIEVDSTIAVGANVYLAGQTAPGDGVQLRLGRSPDRPMMVRAANDVVIRHLRLRPGPAQEKSSSVDGIGIFDSHDVILDHLSVQYATDELLAVGTLRGSVSDITVQDSLFAWGLDRANHSKGKHSKGALICTMDGPGDCGRISLVRNLFAHNRDRNPDVKGTSIGPVEIVNNVFYNPKSQFGEFYDDEGDLRINYIGNTALSGPSTRRSKAPHAVEIYNDRSPTSDVRVYVRDNIDGRHRRSRSEPDELVVRPDDRGYLAPEPFPPLTVEALAPEAALERVLAQAGATAPRRDALDRQAVEDVRNRSGHVVDDPAAAGGWPSLSSGPVPVDSDEDGMPDQWETGHGTDPQTFDAWHDADGNGWANLEDYLNERAAVRVATTQ